MSAPARAWRAFTRSYGANPLHLLALLGSFALVGGVLYHVVGDPDAELIGIWFLAAVIGHDLVLYPLYALADRGLAAGRWARRRVTGRPPRVPGTNHVRIPVLGSLLLLAVFWPTVGGGGEPVLRFAAGLDTAPFLERWLLATAALFLGSAVVYAIRLGREVRKRP
jgi:hypothetical protein